MASMAAARSNHSVAADSHAPRKRRKRAPPAGAANDCFTCASTGAQCDRRRPYCSQCLDDGKDCAGYKTQLTWGNGVASRGKLRGLSLPVAAGIKKAAAPQRSRHRSSASMTSIDTTAFAPVISIPSPASSRGAPRDTGSSSPPQTSPLQQSWDTQPTLQYPATSSHRRWSTEVPPSFAVQDAQSTASPADLSRPFQTLQSERLGRLQSVYPSPASDTNFFAPSHSEPPTYAEPMSYPRPPPLTIPLPSPQVAQSYAPFTPFDTVFNQQQPDFFPQEAAPQARTQDYSGASFMNSDAGQNIPLEQTLLHEALPDPSFDCEEPDVEEIQRSEFKQELVGQSMSSNLGLALQFPVMTVSHFHNIGSTPRLQYLINYYAEVISPVIVAFDGPLNPFRTHVLRLASNSEALQHAIAALAASNLRQRRATGILSTCKTDPARRSSMAHLNLSSADAMAVWDLQQAIREETSLKNHAIALLNQQLSHPLLRLQDSALAVLLILCLFHMCDTGVAKFSTQFQGVRKLLALRKSTGTKETREGQFCTKMFAWWDGVTSSVNEREAFFSKTLLTPPCSALGPMDRGAEGEESESSFETLAGIDTDLFRIVSRLGRLNMLAQGGDVEMGETIISRPASIPTAEPNTGPAVFSGTDSWSQLDFNAWLPPSQLPASDNGLPDDRSELFYRELNETEHILSHWVPSQHPKPGLTPSQNSDLHYISLTFYYATKLYLLRLRHPTLPSSVPYIQHLVQATLSQVENVRADVYLLWPLFIAGSECVGHAERDRVRSRVAEIQGDSGFVNNGVVGGILERVWANMDRMAVKQEEQDGAGVDSGCGRTMTGFRWAQAMKHGAEEGIGEYIVV